MEWKHVIAELKDQAGMSYSDIARDIGARPNTISELASGDSKGPSRKYLDPLRNLYCRRLGKSLPSVILDSTRDAAKAA